MPVAPSAHVFAESLEGRRVRAELESRLFGRRREPLRLGRYLLQHKLGEGGMGMVYAAIDPWSSRQVAIKVVRPGEVRGADRLRREAAAMACLDHPNIVTVRDVGEGDDGLYLVMDLVEGQTLATWLRAGQSWEQVVEIGIQAANALAAAHHLGVVHRDVKPDNIMIDMLGEARLLDFGLAKPLPGTLAENLRSLMEPLTRKGATLGTVGYMAPEQLLGFPITPAVDQFSLCATLFQALCGVMPFTGEIDEIATVILGGQLHPIPDYVEVPRRLMDIICRGLVAEPEQRFASMVELAAALESCSPGSTVEPETRR
ncbi:MAG: serine/threonine-protein kinase [Myxococcota bacterium]